MCPNHPVGQIISGCYTNKLTAKLIFRFIEYLSHINKLNHLKPIVSYQPRHFDHPLQFNGHMPDARV